VAGTLTQGVLVSVSAVAYTRILVSDHIGACLYRPFSSCSCCEIVNSMRMFCCECFICVTVAEPAFYIERQSFRTDPRMLSFTILLCFAAEMGIVFC